MIGPNEDTPTRPGVARRATGEWEPVTTGEFQRVVVEAARERRGASPLAIAGFVVAAIGTLITSVAFSIGIADRLYAKAPEVASMSTKLDTLLITVTEIKNDIKKDKTP